MPGKLDVYGNPSWAWFCGDEWKSNGILSNATSQDPLKDANDCFLNIVTALLHLSFAASFLVILVFTRCHGVSHRKSRYLFRWPGHILRWVLILILLVLAIASIGEGTMSDMTLHGAKLTPQLYLPACCFFITTLTALCFYQLAEIWQASRMCWTLLVYWLFCITEGGIRIGVLYQEDVSIDTARLWITILILIAHILLTTIDLNLIFCKSGHSMQRTHGGRGNANYHLGNQFSDDMKFTEDYVSFLYYITFWWMNWLFQLGFSRPLEVKDLGTLPEVHQSQHLYKQFKEDYERELKLKTAIGRKPSVWKVIVRVFRKDIFYAGLSRLLFDMASFAGPLCLNGVICYVIAYHKGGESTEIPPHKYVTLDEFFSNGFVLVGLIFFANVCQYVMWQQSLYQSNVVGLHVRTAIQTMVYDKSLRLSSYVISGGSMTVGKIANHMSTDAFNLFFFAQRMHYMWAVPSRVIAVLILLYFQVGISTFFCLISLLIVVPIQLLTARLQTRKQKAIMKAADDRLKRSNEMLHGMKLLKLYGWEEMVCATIEKIRKLEMSSIFKYNGCFGINFFMVQITPTLTNFAVFVSYTYLTGQPLVPNKTFAAHSLMNLLGEPMYFVPMVTSLLVNAFISVSRLETFFMATEIQGIPNVKHMNECNGTKDISQMEASMVHYIISDADNETVPLLKSVASRNKLNSNPRPRDYQSVWAKPDRELTCETPVDDRTYALKITNGNFSWSDDNPLPVIRNINLEISNGELVMIVGPVGSGKSSILSAILGEMKPLSGSVKFGSLRHPSSGIAYCSQTAWLMNASLRDNILFGKAYNKRRYQEIIEASALSLDIVILPGGDMTEIGEKGINLSGGQKQRISLARAMYSNNSIVLLDDPLSALDVNVGMHLFHLGILRRLRKSKRTVVLVTHQLQYLHHADKIIVMRNGKIHMQGTFEDIVRRDPDLYISWQEEVIAASESETSDTESEEKERIKTQMAFAKYGVVVNNTYTKGERSDEGQLIEQEDLARGSVSLSAYLYYIGSMGLFWAVAFIFSRLVLESFNISRNFWLCDWSEAGLNSDMVGISEINKDFILVYTGLSFACLVMAALNCGTNVIAAWNAAYSVFIHMLRNISKSPMRFFDTTPIGRVLNRFSSDTQIIDTKLLITTSSLSHFFSSFVFAVIVNAIITPIFIGEVMPIVVIYCIIGVYFMRSSRELQRLDSVTRSPVFAHFSETLGGLTTIRAYGDQARFFNNLLSRIDTNNTPFLYLQAAYGWLGLQMSICGGAMVLMVGLTTLLQATVFGSLDASLVGLGLAYVFTISEQLFNLIRFSADTEMQMNPVERVQYYATLPTENYEGSQPPHDWPRHGKINFSGISVRYADTFPPVLRNVSLTVRPGEKVGICGRTGSGKSSLTLALFRLIKTFKGCITIDGLDIANLPITTLRQRLAIIPQDPVMFTGTIRSNLDPHEVKSDKDLWHALDIAQLRTVVGHLSLQLDTFVSEGGENFSVGQRQLFCLARAFLRNSRIVIMDEATASIDYNTEKVLQEVVNSVFKDKTVLTIAHRVATILECDTIWVLEKGEVIECDSPRNLLARSDSVFHGMVEAKK